MPLQITYRGRNKAAPDPSAAHGVKNIRQCDEDQVRTAVRVDAECEACRKDDQTGDQCDAGIQDRNADCLTGQTSGSVDVTSENAIAPIPRLNVKKDCPIAANTTSVSPASLIFPKSGSR